MEKELDILFGDATLAKENFKNLKTEADPSYEQISTHSMNDKSLIETIKERVEEFKEFNSDGKEELIAQNNSDNALPDELSTQEGVPISTVTTDGIHVADETENQELISTHNSERALDEKPMTTHTEEIDVISAVNSSKFVPESLD